MTVDETGVDKTGVDELNGKCLALYSLSGLPLKLSSLTENTSMITVSSCDVKLQKVLSAFNYIFIPYFRLVVTSMCSSIVVA